MQNFELQFKTTPQCSHLTRGIRLQTPKTVHCRHLEGKACIYDLMSFLAVKKSQFQSFKVAQTLLIKLTRKPLATQCCFKINSTYGKYGITNNNTSTHLGLIIKVIVHPGN